MSVWTLVIDEMLVCKLAKYSQSICSNYAQGILSHVAKPFIMQGVYCLQYKRLHQATQVTLAAIIN